MLAGPGSSRDRRLAMSQASSIRHEPPYTDMQQHSFDRTGEKAAGASVAYDFGYTFSDIGLSGLSVGAWYTRGWVPSTP